MPKIPFIVISSVIVLTLVGFALVIALKAIPPSSTTIQTDAFVPTPFPAAVVLNAQNVVLADPSTHVTDRSKLVASRVIQPHAQQYPDMYQVSFDHPSYQGLLVDGAVYIRVSLFLDHLERSKVDFGRQYDFSSIPLTPQVSAQEVQKVLMGKELSYHDISGKPHSFIAKMSDLGAPEKVLLIVSPRDEKEGIPHLAWKVIVGQSMRWAVYIDAKTGEELKAEALFVS